MAQFRMTDISVHSEVTESVVKYLKWKKSAYLQGTSGTKRNNSEEFLHGNAADARRPTEAHGRPSHCQGYNTHCHEPSHRRERRGYGAMA